MDEARLPTGTVTFLFSDIEGSTELAAGLGTSAYARVLELHQRLLREAFAAHGGIEKGTEGDSFFVVFRDAPSAVAAATEAQRSLATAAWPDGAAVRVRMGIHTGLGVAGGDDYVGMDVNRAARIAASAHGGQVLVSDATRALATGSLPDGVELRDVGWHRLKGLRDRERLHQLTIPGLASDFPPVRSLDASITNLPARVSSFVGRDREIREVEDLVGQARMVTLVGPGGTGKTALAIEVARRVGPRFDDGAWFVALDALTDPQLVASAIVTALGLREIGGRSARERLLDNLPGRSLLLVLDNFEQLMDAATLIGELLLAAPDVTAIVTSRAPLRLGAEQVYAVSPLAVPDANAGVDPQALASVPSVRLFIERARRVQPTFALTKANAEAVAGICRRLDGLPLGIELAAARIALLGPAGILERLERHVPLGGVATRDAPSRQKTLQDTIAWSCDLLDQPARRLFARLPVFVGGWRLEQAEQVCGPAHELGGEVVDVLAELVDQSLVTTEARDDGVRFGMLETVRHEAKRRLAAEERAGLRRRHADAYQRFATAMSPALETRGAAAVARMAEELDNLRAAVRFAVESRDADLGLPFAEPLGQFFGTTGNVAEGSATVQALLGIPGGDEPSASRMRALEAAGTMAYYAGEAERPRQMYRAQLEVAQSLDDKKGIADARWNLFFTEFEPGDWDEALRELDRIEAAYRELEDERAVARVMWARGSRLYTARRLQEAVPLLEEAIERYRALGDLRYIPEAANMLSAISFEQGDPAAATRWLLEAVAVADKAGSASTVIGLPLTALGISRLGHPEEAAVILGAYEGLARRYGVRMPQFLGQLMESRFPVAEIEAALSLAVYDEARRRGDGMRVDDVIAYAVEIAGEPGSAPPDKTRRSVATPGSM